jgi:hypothetical protein
MKTWKSNLHLPFRATELASLGALAMIFLPAGMLVGREQITAGTASSDPAEPVPGVETTVPNHIPPLAVTCLPRAAGRGCGYR